MPTVSTGTGAEVYNRMLAAGLEERGHQVALQFADHKYQYFPWLSGLSPPFACDVTVANSWNAAAFAGHAPLVTVVHHVVHDPALNPYKTRSQAIFHKYFVKPMELSAMRISDKVVAVSETTRFAICEYLQNCDAVSILNGIDTAFFTPAQRRDENSQIKLLFIGKPSRRKRFDLVNQLASKLAGSATLTVIGPAPESGMDMSIGDYRGRVSKDELRNAYREADFLLLPSQVEGFGYAAAEAMACGTPIVCAPSGAVAEISHLGKAAIAIYADRIDEVAEQLIGLKHNHDTYAAMRSAAQKIARTNLDHTRWLDQMEALLFGVAKS